jgi:hypothetical protein
MLTQQLNRTDPETIQVVFTNVDGSGSITTGMGVALVLTGASIDGVSAVKSTAALWPGFIGVSTKDVAINGYGLSTMYGIANSVAFSNVGTSITVTRGDVLVPSAVAGYFFTGALAVAAWTTLNYKMGWAASTVPVDLSNLAQSYVKGLIRAV